MWLSTLNVLLLVLCHLSVANYRHYYVDNKDICPESKYLGSTTKTVEIGTGAAIFELSKPSISFQPSRRNKARQCTILIKVPQGFGIMAYIEQGHLRKSTNDGSCTDYVQFGQEDIVPFLTLKKSDRFCGQLDGRQDASRGFSYDDPGGKMLVWIKLGGRDETSHWPHISRVNMTLIVTAYQLNCGSGYHRDDKSRKLAPPGPNFKKCSADKCIWRNYFCDHHYNCVFDKDLITPQDEAGCNFSDTETTTLDPSQNFDGDDGSEKQLNLITWLLIMFIALAFLLGFMVIVKVKRGASWCNRRRNCDDPNAGQVLQPNDQIQSLAELAAINRPQTEVNVYLPLHMNLNSSNTNVPPSEEPPPAYDDLFPMDYVHHDLEISQETSFSDHNNTAAAVVDVETQQQEEEN